MQYREFCGKKISLLGFGAMRLPTIPESGAVDVALTERLIDRAIEGGVNYFDTAYPYHGGRSELILRDILKKYPRESYCLADKYPGHQISSSYDPKAVFEEQLEKCGVDYFDFYLLHNVNDTSMDTYLDERWGIIEYFKEQRRLGKIRHLGFSSHGTPENLREFLDVTDGAMEFCQIQLNYLDYTLQRANEKCKILADRGIPVWVMEPVRGGKLAKLPEHLAEKLTARRPNESVASWGFRYLHTIPEVTVILSGMSDIAQVEDNLATFSGGEPLTEEEISLLYEIAEGLKSSVPCTACRYCIEGCPMGLDIPMLLSVYNEVKIMPSVNAAIRVQALPADKQPSACIACGRCMKICPQRIDVPKAMIELSRILEKIPKWKDVSREREEAAKRAKAK